MTPDRRCTSDLARRRRLRSARWSRSVIVAALAICLVGETAVVRHAGAASSNGVAADAFTRSLPAGLGSADFGGTYRTQSNAPKFLTSTSSGRAVLAAVAPSAFAQAWLPSVASTNSEARAQFTVPPLPAAGSGLYLGVELRKQVAGDTLRARLRIDPNGGMGISFTRVQNNVEAAIGSELFLGRATSAGKLLVLDAAVTGTTPVTLTGRVYTAGTPVPAWQYRVTDSSATRIATAGAVGMWVYTTSRSVSPVSYEIDAFDAYEIPAGGLGTLPPVGTATAQPPTVPPATPSPVGSAMPGKTKYPVPSSGAVFVAPTGNDAGTGTSAAPVRTIARAVAIARSGSTIVVRAGRYHEVVLVPADKRLTIQPYPNEAVWLDGTAAVAGWRLSGTMWVHDKWTFAFDSSPSFTRGQDSGFVNAAHPMAAHPDEVWIGGREIAQVASAAAVKPGTFYVDYAADKLYIGDNPAAGVRASTLGGQALEIRSAGTVVRGLGVTGYATSAPDLGTVILSGKGALAENLMIVDNATIGLVVTSTDVSLRNLTVGNNGMLGVSANYADRLTITRLLVEGNNSEQFNTAPVAGGAKITRSRDVTVQGGHFTKNLGSALWLDESCYDVTVVGNTISDNAKHGLTWEIGALGVIADNTIAGNARDGIKINDVTHVRVWNNTLRSNGLEVLLAQDDRRASNLSFPGHDPRRPLPDPTVSWLLGDVDFHNNLIESPRGYVLQVVDGSGQRSAGQMDIAVDGNNFGPATGRYHFIWGRSGGANPQAFTSVAAFETGTTVAKGNGESVSTTITLALPTDIAAQIGQPPASRHVGAF